MKPTCILMGSQLYFRSSHFPSPAGQNTKQTDQAAVATKYIIMWGYINCSQSLFYFTKGRPAVCKQVKLHTSKITSCPQINRDLTAPHTKQRALHSSVHPYSRLPHTHHFSFTCKSSAFQLTATTPAPLHTLHRFLHAVTAQRAPPRKSPCTRPGDGIVH